jgi:DNA-binding NarL/FixJ family response regulator
MVLRCLILDGQMMFGQLLCTVLAPINDLAVLGIARTCREGLELCRAHRPDLLILDPILPDGSGCSVVHGALEANPHCRFLVVSAMASSFVCPPELQSHLLDVIDKTETFELLTAALTRGIHDSSTGQKPLQPVSCDPLNRLTTRQQEVFRLIGRGAATKEIARRLGLERTTVESHRKEISRRLGVSGAELVRLAALQVDPWPESGG